MLNKSKIIINGLRILSWIPLPVLYVFSLVIGSLIYWLPNKMSKVAAKNLELCFPELSTKERNHLLHQSLRQSVNTTLEMGAMWFWPIERLNRLDKGVIGHEVWQEAYQHGKGVIALTPHIGQWEFLGLFAQKYVAMTSLYRPPRLADFDEFLVNARRRMDNTLAPTTPLGVRMLYGSLRKGKMAGILPDQDPGNGGVFAPFFGIEANTMTLITKLAERTHSSIIIAYAERLSWGRGYITHIHAVDSEGILNPDPVLAAGALNKAIEVCIREQPTQYQWIYKRFKKRPAGEDKFY